jgi:glycosyltransferase involved in cell wall biosynthesis
MPLPSTPRISLVIPAYNEERYLPRLLDSIDVAKRAYSRGEGAIETVVADNASTDRTAAISVEHGARVAPVAKRAIAAARNAGAAAARGEILGFVDADMRIHPASFDAIDAALASDRIVGGATGVTMERWSAGLALTFAVALPFLWVTHFDTGIVFCRRSDFEAIGGYDERLKYAEDVAFLLALRRLGRTRRQRLTRLTRVKCVASARKFDEHGDWHYFTMIPAAAVGWALNRRLKLSELEKYWYEPKR